MAETRAMTLGADDRGPERRNPRARPFAVRARRERPLSPIAADATPRHHRPLPALIGPGQAFNRAVRFRTSKMQIASDMGVASQRAMRKNG